MEPHADTTLSIDRHYGPASRQTRPAVLAAIAALEEIERSCVGIGPAVRQIQALRRSLAEPERSQEWVNSVEMDWNLQLGRRARLRNALAHGSPTTGTSIAMAASFVSGLVNTSLYLRSSLPWALQRAR